MNLEYRVRATMSGAVVDLTPYVLQMQWQHGQLQPNQLGTIYTGGIAQLTLKNYDGAFNVYNPGMIGAVRVDPTPQPAVTIGARYPGEAWETMFTGHSTGLVNTTPLSRQNLAEMPIEGPLARITNGYHDKLYTRITGTVGASQAFIQALDDVGYTGPRRVQQSIASVLGFKLNNLIGGYSRRRGSFARAGKALAEVEISRIYDDRIGTIVFENRHSRASVPADALVLSPGLAFNVTIGDVRDSIVNVVSSSVDGFESQGEQNMTFIKTLPLVTMVPPGGVGIFLTIDRTAHQRAVFMQSWEQPDRGVTFNYTLPDILDSEIGVFPVSANTLRIDVPNPTTSPATFTILRWRGEPFQEAYSEFVVRRSQASVDLYNKELAWLYPGELVSDIDEAQARLDWAVNTHNGLDLQSQAFADPLRQVNVKLRLNKPGTEAFLGAEVSSFVRATLPELGLSGAQANAPFWVEQAIHQVLPDGTHDVTLRMTDARATSAWSRYRMEFGVNTRGAA